MEVAVLKRLQQNSISHICEFMGCGRNDKVNYVIMTLLGPSLSELRKHQPHQHFTISTTLRVGIQIIDAVQSMHDCGFLHRDIKPSNFAIGTTPETSRSCYMFDYGLARQYTTVTGEVRQPRPVAGFRGTVRYASLNAHLSRDLGRHDDLWSVFYLLVELAVGQLPWRRIRDKEEAGECKAQYDHRKLIRGLPVEFVDFLNHLKSLSYFDKPDYSLVTRALQDAIDRLGIQESDPYDWEQDFSVPSMTTASIVSPPAVKIVSEGKEIHEKSRTNKPNQEPSKTNCSEVGGLSENGHRLEPNIEQIHQPDQSSSHRGKVMAEVNVKRTSEEENVNKLEKIIDDIEPYEEASPESDYRLEDSPHILNHYISEEEKVDENQEVLIVIGTEDKVLMDVSSKASGKNHLASSDSYRPDLMLVTKTNLANALDVDGGGTGIAAIKSYRTESLNRFFELGGNKVKDNHESRKNDSTGNVNKGQQDNILPLPNSKPLSSSEKVGTEPMSSSYEYGILNNAIIYPNDSPRKELVENAFNSSINEEGVRSHSHELMKQKGRYAEYLIWSGTQTLGEKLQMVPSGKKNVRSRSNGDTKSLEEIITTRTSDSESNNKDQVMHRLQIGSNATQHDSSMSLELPLTRLPGSSNDPILVGKNKITGIKLPSNDDHHENVASDDRERMFTGKAKLTLPISVIGGSGLPSPTTASIENELTADHKPSLRPHRKSQVKYTAKVNSGMPEMSIRNTLEVVPTTMKILPRPPPNPPPHNYSMSLSVRRRRFVRSAVPNEES